MLGSIKCQRPTAALVGQGQGQGQGQGSFKRPRQCSRRPWDLSQWAKGNTNGQRLEEGKHLKEVVLHVVTHGLAPGLPGCLPLCFSTLSLLCQLSLLSSVRCITYASLSASLTGISRELVRWSCPANSNQRLPWCQPK